jgi:hypothetical protein
VLFLEQRGEATGTSSGGGELLVRMLASFCCEIGKKASISRCTRAWESEWDQRKGVGYRWLIGIDELLWLFLRAPVGDSVSLAAN